jgi:CO/xanthine dehydrogenase Mo-binding subunit
MASVGRSVRRKDGDGKVTGAARYVDDLTFPGMLHGATVRSTIPCGRIAAIEFGFETSGFVIADARDIPGRNAIVLITDDQPALAERIIRHAAEPILLIAHESREALLDARIDVRYERDEPVLDPLRSSTVFKQIRIEKGDVGRGFAAAAAIVEGEYRTSHQEQLYIETNGVIAVPEDGGVTIYGSLQCPYYVHKALKGLLGLPAEKIRVVQAETGGGFGGKEEYPSILAGHAALLALKAQRPVKMIYDRMEDLVATTKRHPSIVRHRTGVTRDGRLTALEIDVLMDAGAYVTLSPVVLSRGVIHASGPYRCDHVRIDGRAVMTNTPPNGAFRGFGAPQTQFAIEAHMDVIAERLRLDPVTIRERNALRPGDTTATGQEMGRDCSALQVLRAAVKRTDFRRKHRQLATPEPREAGRRRGIGLSLFFHGAGFTGAGEVMLASRASLELTERGARILVANTEIGQGTRTMLAQIVADTLRAPYDAIEVSAADTARVPDSGPTVASRTCMVVGGLLERCAREMRRTLGRMSPREYLRRHGPLVITKQYEKPPDVSWDDEAYRGHAYATYAWGCDVVEIEVDPVTGEVRPTRVTAVQEIGKAIHPRLAAGQIEGGTVQGLGYALLEEVVMRDGAMANGQLTNYIIPTTLDTPPLDVVILENPYPHGPFGAKGVGELPMDGPAPAVVNALRHAGVAITSIPATPERVLANLA